MTPEERTERKRIRRKQRNLLKKGDEVDALPPDVVVDDKENGVSGGGEFTARLVHPAAMRRLKPLEKEIRRGSGKLNIPDLDQIVQDFR